MDTISGGVEHFEPFQKDLWKDRGIWQDRSSRACMQGFDVWRALARARRGRVSKTSGCMRLEVRVRGFARGRVAA